MLLLEREGGEERMRRRYAVLIWSEILGISGFDEVTHSFPVAHASPRWRASNLRFEPCHPAGGGITLPLAKLPCEWGSTPKGG